MNQAAAAAQSNSSNRGLESLLLAVVEQHRDGILVLEKDGRPLYLNRQAMTLFDIDPLAGFDERKEKLARIVKSFSAVLAEARLSRKGVTEKRSVADGRFVELSVAPVGNAKGDLAAFILTMHDVTDTMEMEHNLRIAARSNAELMQAISEAVPVGISITDQKGRFKAVNSRFCDMFGLHDQQLLGRVFTDIVPEEDRSTAAKNYMWLLAGHGEFPPRWRLRHTDGTVFEGEVSTSVFFGRNGQPFVVSCFRAEDGATNYEQLWHQQNRILDELISAVLVTSPDGAVSDVNPAALDLFGWTKGDLLGKQIDFLFPREANTSLAQIFSDLKETGGFWLGEVEYTKVNQTTGTVELKIVALVDDNDQNTGFLLIGRDLSRSSDAEHSLARSEARLKSLVEHSNDMIQIIDGKAALQFSSPAVERILGYKSGNVLGTKLSDYVHPDDQEMMQVRLGNLVDKPGEQMTAELRFRHIQGHYVPLECTATNLQNDPGIHGILVNSRDVTERKKQEERLLHGAYHDPLTDLPNRAFFNQRLALSVSRSQRYPQYVSAVMFIDLDHFKRVNDTLGHSAGDQLLITVATRLKHCLRDIDTIARLSGDEFAILLEEAGNLDHIKDVGNRVLQAMATPVEVMGRQIYVSASIGIVLGSKDYRSADQLLRDADIAMYRAKNVGRGQYVFFDETMRQEAQDSLALEAELRKAVEKGELRLIYVPIVEMASGKAEMVEALIRWEHPTKGLLRPSAILGVAEKPDLAADLTNFVLETACRDLKKWLANADPATANMRVCINLSDSQLVHGQLLTTIEDVVKKYQIDGKHLAFEVNEMTIIHRLESHRDIMLNLRRMGAQLYVDDFGTGHSSIAQLNRLPVDALKIDGSFVQRMREDEDSMVVVKSILDLARHLKIRVIAEGIEQPEDRKILTDLGCELGQGFLFRSAVEANEIPGEFKRNQ